jgi:hypothetical protein
MSSFEEQTTNTDQKPNVNKESEPIPKLVIPLSFWFNDSNNFKEFDISKIKVSIKINSIMDSIDFNSKDPEYYSNIRDSILECRYELQKKLRSHILIWPSPCYFQQELDLIDNHIRGIIVPEKFYSPLILDNTNEINGYTLYEFDNIIMDWFSFIELTKLYKSSKTLLLNKFLKNVLKFVVLIGVK